MMRPAAVLSVSRTTDGAPSARRKSASGSAVDGATATRSSTHSMWRLCQLCRLTGSYAPPIGGRVRCLVIAHRGASGTHPENTMAAFRRAVDVGAGMIELDVQLTRDRHVVVIHDATLDRTTDGRGPVSAVTLAELRRLDGGGWFAPGFAGERVPTLAEVLAAVHVPVNVELKPARDDDGLERRALGEVEEAGAIGR